MQNEHQWWRWNDAAHIDAHRSDFRVPPERVMEHLKPELQATRPADGSGPIWLHRDFPFPEIVGITGLREVPPDGSRSFWAYRRGRRTPSHLCHGTKEPTTRVCVWGWWEAGLFIVHTLYPGWVAPREVHDPDLPPADIPAAIEFWRCRAIVVESEDYTDSPDA